MPSASLTAYRVLPSTGSPTRPDNATQGILDTTDLIYYASFAFFGLFLTHSVIQSRRWR
jgi:hypothetical protein